jgi:hypothetical protein
MPPENDASTTAHRQLREACADLRRRLYAGANAHAETYLAAYPALSLSDDCALELIYTEFVVRQELGQQPTAAELGDRFPHWRARLDRLVQVGDLFKESSSSDPSGVR